MFNNVHEHDFTAALPDVTGTVELPGLEASVTVHRDRWGIPHIRAETEHDLFLAQGFVTAQDRLWQMDCDRVQALGRWAEFAGPEGVEQDRLLRAAGMGRTAKKDYEIASALARAMADAYAAGVNAFLDTSKAPAVEYSILGRSPQRWEHWHCLTVYKMRNTLLGTFEPKLQRTLILNKAGPRAVSRLIGGTQKGQLITVPPGSEFDGPALNGLEAMSKAAEHAQGLGEIDAGSNAWAIGGHLTESGLPLVAGDSHRRLEAPNIYYQIHLSCPRFTVIGYSLPGVPGALHFCHNEHVAWGMTYGGIDTQDLFIEQFRDGQQGRQVLYQDEWEPVRVLHETIRVRGAEPVPIEVTITHHGPVIAGDPATGKAIAVCDPGLIGPTRWLDAARDAMRSRSVDELHDALQHWTDRVNNYAVADVHGNFGYLHAGKVPIRPESNGWCAVPGWTGEHDWSGAIPHDELPKAVNPDCGYVVTCNQRVTGHDYPYYVGIAFAPDHRARRVQSRIHELKPGTATVDDMVAIHAERVSLPARIFASALSATDPGDERCAAAQALLRAWDHAMDRDGAAPTIYAATRAKVARRLAQHILGDLADHAFCATAYGKIVLQQIEIPMLTAIEQGDASILPDGESWQSLLAEALKAAVADLTRTLGPDMSRWQWGRVHHTRQQHALSAVCGKLAAHMDPPTFAVHGDSDTPLAGSYTLDTPFIARTASVNRYVHDPSDWTRSVWIVPLGASGHPASPHWSDQAEQWSNVQTIPQLWDWEQIEREAETTQRLDPEGD